MKCFLTLLTSLAVFVAAQAPNLYQQEFPNLRTASQNTSKYQHGQQSCGHECTNAQPTAYFIAAIPRDVVQRLVAPYDLLPVPGDNATLFPQGWDDANHPVIVYAGLQNQIKLRVGVPLSIDELLGSSAYVPYTDVLRDGQSAIQHPVKNFIGATNEEDLMTVVPGKHSSHTPRVEEAVQTKSSH